MPEEENAVTRTQLPKPPQGSKKQQPKTMGTKSKVTNSPVEWFRQFPKLQFPSEPDNSFVLIDDDDLKSLLKDHQIAEDTPAAQRVRQDMDILNEELMPLFRERDHIAKREQNRYRLYQLSFLMLATAATAVGSFQVWALQTENAKQWILSLGLLETFIALLTTFIATLMGNRQPLSEWLENRRLAEQLRREYYRFLTDSEPYDALKSAHRQTRLARRSAAINNRKDPDSIID